MSNKAAATYHPGMGPKTPITPNVSDRCLYAYHRQCGGDTLGMTGTGFAGPCRCACHG